MYEQNYKAFSQNIHFAARILNYYLHISAMAKDGTSEHEALNKTPRFWNDFNFVALQTVVIFLGKIFDEQNRTYNLAKLLDALPKSLEYFSKNNLKIRKEKALKAQGSNLDIQPFIDKAHELNMADVDAIKAEAEKAEKLWEKIEPLRHRFYAHHQMLTDEERDSLFKKVTYGELEDLVQILLNISFALDQAAFNGLKPDFSENYLGPANRAESEADRLLQMLVKGTSNP